MVEVFICEGVRTPIGRYGGQLSSVRADDLAAIPIRALIERKPQTDWSSLDDVILGCANQAGEDNRNVARMAALLAGLGEAVPGATVNRLCGSGMDAVAIAANAIRAGEATFMLAGGVESMSRAPFVMGKSESAFSRSANVFDSTIGWRFVNPLIRQQFGVDSMPETAENVAQDFNVSREHQDSFALRSQRRATIAQQNGRLAAELVTFTVPQRKGDPKFFDKDEHPRETTIAKLASLRPFVKRDGVITAGNSSGVNDGSAAVILASESAALSQGLDMRARFVAASVVGVPPRIMGIGAFAAAKSVLEKSGLRIADIDVIEINEAFASQALACIRKLGLPDDAEHVNPNGGAIALGHPLGMSGTRLVITATEEMQRRRGRYALVAMCIGVGQGIACILERV